MSRAMNRAFWCLAVLLLLADMAYQLMSPSGGDKEWLLLATRMMLQGRTLYVDIFEVNPPLVIWLYSLPVWLSLKFTWFTDYQALVAMGFVLSGISAWLGVQLIRFHPAFAGKPHKQWLFGLLIGYTLIFFSTPIYFFDRDQIFFVLVFAYFLRFMPSLADAALPVWLRVAVGLMAGVGFCVKPHTVVAFAALQLTHLLRARPARFWFSLENVIIAAVAAFYFFCIWRFAPDYLNTVMPMSAATYGGFSRKVNGYLFAAVAFGCAGLTFAEFRPRHTTPYRRDIYYLAGVCAALFAYALAGNGWGYTYNPLLCMLIFLSAWVFAEFLWLYRQDRAQGGSGWTFLVGMGTNVVNLTANALYIALCIWTYFTAPVCGGKQCVLDPYFKYMHERQVRSFSSFSMNLRRWTELERATHAKWDTRFNHLWMLPQLLLASPDLEGRYKWIKDYVTRAYATDLTRWQPEIVFVDRSDGIFNYGLPIDIPAFFAEEPAFREAWSHYRLEKTLDSCAKPEQKRVSASGVSKIGSQPVQIDCRYDIYRRF